MVLVAALLARTSLAGNPLATGKWVGTWVSAQQLVEPQNLPPPPGLAGSSLRQVIQPSLGGSKIRLTLSNAAGEGPLTISSMTVGRSTAGAGVASESSRAVAFGGRHAVTLPAGVALTSDPVELEVRPFENLAVTIHCATVPANLTGHPGSRTTSFILPGNRLDDAAFSDAAVTDHWYFLAAVDVWTDPDAAAVVILGDSITDGRGSTTNQNNRWPNLLSRRLQHNPRTAKIAVLNQGIGGNRLLDRGLGPSALERFDRDVLAPPGVRWLVVFEGVNDLGAAVGTRASGETAPDAQDIIHAYSQLIMRAHAHGLLVYGCTITPFQGFDRYFNAATEADRQRINQWIRTPGNFDGVIDFDQLSRDVANPLQLSHAVDGGDHLHPSAAGYQVMADGIDLMLFEPR